MTAPHPDTRPGDHADAGHARQAGPAWHADAGPGQHAEPVIDYHFPVEVHTIGTLPPDERERLARTHLDRLGQELATRL